MKEPYNQPPAGNTDKNNVKNLLEEENVENLVKTILGQILLFWSLLGQGRFSVYLHGYKFTKSYKGQEFLQSIDFI